MRPMMRGRDSDDEEDGDDEATDEDWGVYNWLRYTLNTI